MTLPSPLMGRGARASWRSFTKFSPSCHQLLQWFAMKFKTPKWTMSFLSAQTVTTRRKSIIRGFRRTPQDYECIQFWKTYQKPLSEFSSGFSANLLIRFTTVTVLIHTELRQEQQKDAGGTIWLYSYQIWARPGISRCHSTVPAQWVNHIFRQTPYQKTTHRIPHSELNSKRKFPVSTLKFKAFCIFKAVSLL